MAANIECYIAEMGNVSFSKWASCKPCWAMHVEPWLEVRKQQWLAYVGRKEPAERRSFNNSANGA